MACCDPQGVLERFTDRAREVVVLAREEACNSGHRNIGAEHLLLGLLDQDDGAALQALASLGVTADRVREMGFASRTPGCPASVSTVRFRSRHAR